MILKHFGYIIPSYGDAEAQGIYAICNIVNGREYIGETEVAFSVRWKQHISRLMKGIHHCRRLQDDWNTFGRRAFVFHVLETVERSDDPLQIYMKERTWIERRHGQSMALLYNGRRRSK